MGLVAVSYASKRMVDAVLGRRLDIALGNVALGAWVSRDPRAAVRDVVLENAPMCQSFVQSSISLG